MTNRKIYLLALAVILILGLIVFLVISTRSPQKVSLDNKIAPPSIIDRSSVAFEVESKLSAKGTTIPSTLPVYSVSTSPLLFEQFSGIAKNLGFTDNPQTLSDATSGTIFDWSDLTSELRVVPSIHIIDYKNSGLIAKNQTFPRDTEIIAAAKTFLDKNGFIQTQNIEYSKITFLNFGSEFSAADRNSADTADVKFTEKIEGYPIVNSTPGVGTISVKLNKDNQITAVYLEKSGTTLDKKEYPIKDFAEVIANLKKAKIQSPETTTRNITKVTIDNLSIAYLKEYSPLQTTLQPIFVLTGVAQTSEGTSPALLYLPAVSEKNLLSTPSPNPVP